MKLVTYREAAEFLGIPVSTLYALTSQGRIPVISFGPRFKRFDLVALRAWFVQHRADPRDGRPHGGGR